jgi:hypothetical protein
MKKKNSRFECNGLAESQLRSLFGLAYRVVHKSIRACKTRINKIKAIICTSVGRAIALVLKGNNVTRNAFCILVVVDVWKKRAT